jgi:hypothetical protein
VMCKMLLLVPRNFVLLRVPNFLSYSLLLYTQCLDIKYSAIWLVLHKQDISLYPANTMTKLPQIV